MDSNLLMNDRPDRFNSKPVRSRFAHIYKTASVSKSSRLIPNPNYQIPATNFTNTLDRHFRRGIIQPAVFIPDGLAEKADR